MIRFEQVWKEYRYRPKTLGETWLRGLTKRRTPDCFWALRDISFELKPGQALGLIGPNGAGKSTILKLISGITRPTKGAVTRQGTIAPLIELGAGFHSELTGRENIELNATILGMSRADIRSKMEPIIEFSELREFIDTPVKHYSSGMYVRLGFSVAAHLEPDILLVDEVLAVGDAGFRARCLERIAQLRRAGTTICFVTHNILSIRGLCDRAIFIEKGAVVADGDPDTVVTAYNHYLSGRADFNFVTKRVEDGTRDVRIVAVELCGDDGVPRTRFRFGETLQVRVRYELERPLDSPVFGVDIRRSDGLLCAMARTDFSGVSPGLIEQHGQFEVDLGPIHLTAASYMVGGVIFDSSATVPYDYRPIAHLEVEGVVHADGLLGCVCLPPSKWILASAGRPLARAAEP